MGNGIFTALYAEKDVTCALATLVTESILVPSSCALPQTHLRTHRQDKRADTCACEHAYVSERRMKFTQKGVHVFMGMLYAGNGTHSVYIYMFTADVYILLFRLTFSFVSPSFVSSSPCMHLFPLGCGLIESCDGNSGILLGGVFQLESNGDGFKKGNRRRKKRERL